MGDDEETFGTVEVASIKRRRAERNVIPEMVWDEVEECWVPEGKPLFITSKRDVPEDYFAQKFHRAFAKYPYINNVELSDCSISCSQVASLASAMRNNQCTVYLISVWTICERCKTSSSECIKLVNRAFLRTLRLNENLRPQSYWYITQNVKVNLHAAFAPKAARAPPTMLDVLDAARDQFQWELSQ